MAVESGVVQINTDSSSPFSGARGADSHMAHELATQPENWLAARVMARQHRLVLPQPGEHVAIVGCGSSLYIARAIAELRERSGHGPTDARPAGDAKLSRRYDRLIAISRSGTTTEVLQLLEDFAGRAPVTILTADPQTRISDYGDVISLAEIDEQSVVQTRTATTALAVFRWHLGHDLTSTAAQARVVLAQPESEYDRVRSVEQITFIGMGWGFGVAEEASLKLKESTQSWTESFHMTEYRHGPISVAAPGRAVWALGPLIPGLAQDIANTGAVLISTDRDPMAELVSVQRLCTLRAHDRGLDPDRPRNLTRSIVLSLPTTRS